MAKKLSAGLRPLPGRKEEKLVTVTRPSQKPKPPKRKWVR